MKRSVVIFEAEGGNDKGPDGHRADSAPMLEALRRRGFEGELCFYKPDRSAELLERFAGEATVALSRVPYRCVGHSRDEIWDLDDAVFALRRVEVGIPRDRLE